MAAARATTLREMVASGIRDAIASGTYPPDARIPPEETLVAQYGVSRETVRRALDTLTAEGLITAGQGRAGRNVQRHDPMTVHVTRTESRGRADERATAGADAWSADVTDLGHVPGQAITVAIEDATPDMAARLEIEPGAPVVIRRHLRTIDGVASNFSDTYYDAKLAEGTAIMHPADITEGVIAYMRDKMGIHQVWFTVEFGARMPTPEESRQLRIPPGIPVLTEHRTGYDPKRPVKVTVTIWPAHKVRLLCEFPG
ncbi:MAG: GntR family transcriptional regulator [Streptosporangiaceae bacterium]